MKLLIALGIFIFGAANLGLMTGALMYMGVEGNSRLEDALVSSLALTGGIIGVILTSLGIAVTRQALEEVFPELKSLHILSNPKEEEAHQPTEEPE